LSSSSSSSSNYQIKPSLVSFVKEQIYAPVETLPKQTVCTGQVLQDWVCLAVCVAGVAVMHLK
jgi:hypothetical protein